jgi:hypothetical protein
MGISATRFTSCQTELPLFTGNHTSASNKKLKNSQRIVSETSRTGWPLFMLATHSDARDSLVANKEE